MPIKHVVHNNQPMNMNMPIEGLVSGLEEERKARQAAEAANATKTALLALMGQDLRAPMESVAAMTNRLLASPVSQRQDIEAFAHSAQVLFSALHEVLDFADLETGAAELAVEPFDLHVLVGAAAAELHTRAGAIGLTSGVEMTPNCPRFILGDEARVRQVLMALVEAALGATTEGSVLLYVNVNEEAHPFTVRFDIIDTGTGLNEAEIESLFQPRTDTSRAGGGLKLPIARRLAEVMGGGLGCSSAVGQGTLYWFTFQSVAADEGELASAQASMMQAQASQAAQQAAAKAPTTGALSGHVLVVVSNAVNRMLIGSYLEEFGLSHETVDSGTAALMCLAARPYDLVLVDMVLPDYTGAQMAKRIRDLQARTSDVPIVGVAETGSEDDFQDLVAAGVNARVAKPIQGRTLYAALAPFLSALGQRGSGIVHQDARQQNQIGDQ